MTTWIPIRKLTYEQAQEIRLAYSLNKTSHKELADKYGVSPTTIRFIVNNKRYNHPSPRK